jgi:CheY-like chemotaxis protein
MVSEEERLSFTVQDNGKGIDLKATAAILRVKDWQILDQELLLLVAILIYLRNMEKGQKQSSSSDHKGKKDFTSLIIVEDHPVVVEGLQILFNSSGRYHLEGVAGTGKECLQLAKWLTPDVLLLDINLPDISGIDLCKVIIEKYPGQKILALTTYNERVFIQQMLDNGALGYVLKNASSEEIMEGVDEVSREIRFLCTEAENFLKENPGK